MKKSFFVILLVVFLSFGATLYAQTQKAPPIPAGTAEDYFNRGNQFRQEGDLEQAIADYTSAIKAYSKHAKAYYNRANCYAKLNKLNEAIADYTKAVEINPKYTEAYYNMGNTYTKQGKHAQAIASYTKALESNSKYAPAYCNRGNAYQAQGNLQQAITDYNKAIELNPNFAGAYSNRGNAYQAQGNLQQAIADYNKAIELNPNFAGFYANRGNIYQTQGNLQKAVEDYNEAISLNPNDSASFYNRGLAYYGLEQYGKSLADYTSAINQSPSKDAYDDFVRYYPQKKPSDTGNVRNEITSLFEKKLGLEKKEAPPVTVAAAPVAPAPVTPPAPQTPSKVVTASPEEEVRTSVNNWLNSWETGDMEQYASSYDAASFRAQGMNLDGWLKYKKDVRNKSQNIQIEIEDLKITSDGKTAKAEFIQHYRSSILKDKGKKTLLLRKSGKDWKIYSETWTKM